MSVPRFFCKAVEGGCFSGCRELTEDSCGLRAACCPSFSLPLLGAMVLSCRIEGGGAGWIRGVLGGMPVALPGLYAAAGVR